MMGWGGGGGGAHENIHELNRDSSKLVGFNLKDGWVCKGKVD